MGHFAGTGGTEAYADAFVEVTVVPDPGMLLTGNDVISALQLSLLEAVQGCSKMIRTVKGEVSIQVPSGSKHREEVVLDGYGVANKNGNHRIVLDVRYPDDIAITLTK